MATRNDSRILLQLHSSLAFRNSLQRGERLLGQVIGLGVGRITPGLHVVLESNHGIADHGCQVGIATDELGWRRKRQSQQIVEDQNLPIALGAGADTDGRDLQLARDHAGDLARDAFENDTTGASALQGDRVVHQLLDGLQGLALDLVSTHGVQRLRRKSDVADHGNLRLDHAFDQAGALLAALDLHRLGARLLDKASSVTQSVALCDMDRSERHVGHQKCPFDAAPYRTRVVQHLLHSNRQGIFIAQHHHAERVADQDHVNAGLIHQPRAGIVVGGQTSDDFLTLLFFEKGGRSDLRAEVAGGDTHDVLQCSSPTWRGYRLYPAEFYTRARADRKSTRLNSSHLG